MGAWVRRSGVALAPARAASSHATGIPYAARNLAGSAPLARFLAWMRGGLFANRAVDHKRRAGSTLPER